MIPFASKSNTAALHRANRLRHTGGRPALDLAGQRFAHFTAVERAPRPPGTSTAAHWLCRCDCGAERIVSATNLVHGGHGSCGCARPRQESLVGHRFGRLLVEAHVGGAATVVCDCGVRREVRARALRDRAQTSCGCGKADRALALVRSKAERAEAARDRGVEQVFAAMVEATLTGRVFSFLDAVDALGLRNDGGLRRAFRERYGAPPHALYRRLVAEQRRAA